MQLLQNFFDPSTPSMTKRRDATEGEKKGGGEREKTAENSGLYIIASSLPPERSRPNNDCCNAARSCQFENGLKVIMIDG